MKQQCARLLSVHTLVSFTSQHSLPVYPQLMSLPRSRCSATLPPPGGDSNFHRGASKFPSVFFLLLCNLNSSLGYN